LVTVKMSSIIWRLVAASILQGSVGGIDPEGKDGAVDTVGDALGRRLGVALGWILGIALGVNDSDGANDESGTLGADEMVGTRDTDGLADTVGEELGVTLGVALGS